MKYWHITVRGYSASGRLIVAADTEDIACNIAFEHLLREIPVLERREFDDIVINLVELSSDKGGVLYDDCEIWRAVQVT